MSKFLTLCTLSGISLALSVSSAAAQAARCGFFFRRNCGGGHGGGNGGPLTPVNVPEIDASAGLLAMAAVAAAMLLVWERQRRAR